MTKKVTLLIAAVLMVMVGSLALQAEARRPDMMKHSRFGIRMAEKNMIPARMLLQHKDELGLSDQQVAKIEGMQTKFQEAHIRGQADIKVKQLKLRNYLKSDKIDRKKLEQMIRDVAALKTDMQIDRMHYMLDVKSVLTAEQLKKIDQFKKQRRQQWFKNRRGPRGDRAPRRFNQNPGSGV